jgi:hypothetical protein
MGWLIPRQGEAWFEVQIGEPSEAHLWIGNDNYLSTVPFISQSDAESFVRWCIVDKREPIRTTRQKLPEDWPRQPRAWVQPETATWELFVERGYKNSRWWWLLLVADQLTTAVAGTFRSRDEAVGFHTWLQTEGSQIPMEKAEPVQYSFDGEPPSWFAEIEQDIADRRADRRIDFDEALAEVERPKRAKPDLFEVMRRHEARDRSAGGNGA